MVCSYYRWSLCRLVRSPSTRTAEGARHTSLAPGKLERNMSVTVFILQFASSRYK